MKQFIFSVLAVTVFCVGLGSLAEHAGASFKSDEKALAIIRDARQALGGDTAIASIRSMVIGGQTTRTIKIDGVERTEPAETEIVWQLPDKLMKTVAVRHDDGKGGEKSINRQVDVVVVGDKQGVGEGRGTGTGSGVKRIVIKKDDGTVQELTGAEAEKVIAEDGGAPGDNVRKIIIKKSDGSVEELTGEAADKMVLRKVDEDKLRVTTDVDRVSDGQHVMIKRLGGPEQAMKHNELLRLTLGLLLAAPQGMDVSYTFGGETDIDGTTCNIVVAEFAGSSYKLFIGKTSNLPVMISYRGVRMPDVVMFRTKAPEGGGQKDVVFNRKVEGPPIETAEFNVKFSDYRSVSGVQLPFRWVQTVGGSPDETFDVAAYDINPVNIADRFNSDKVKVKIEN